MLTNPQRKEQVASTPNLNQQAKISQFKGQVLHTRNDDLISVSHAERLYAWANQPKEMVVSERGVRLVKLILKV